MGILLSRAKHYDWLFRTLMPMLRRQDLLRRTVFLLGGKVGIWKQARELVVMSEPKSTGPLVLPADKVTKGFIPLELMQTSLRSHLSRMPHYPWTAHQRRKKYIRLKGFTLDSSSHQTGDAAFTPSTPQDLHHSRANTDSLNPHNTQHTRAKQSALLFMQKGTQPSQTCPG
jgi:hypothetical protein